ncbi:MAG TPA: hypothetical protein VMU75_13565 [Acidimicrobiales bacterium]|nr:hypothetical protein [Acidimicrobiales bacterium]
MVMTLALGASAFAASAALAVAASAGVATPSSVLSAAKAAIAKQTGGHLTVTVKTSSSASSEKIVADLGTTSGLETISEGKATVTLRLTPAYGYISGDSAGLTTIFGLTSAQARKIGKDWVSLKAGTSQYSGLKADATISSVAGVLPAVKGTKLSTETVKGVKRYVLTWTSAATSSTPKLSDKLILAAAVATLPIEEIASGKGVAQETIKLTKWGERVVVSAPPAHSTIAYSKI